MSTTQKVIGGVLVGLTLLGGGLYMVRDKLQHLVFSPTRSQVQQGITGQNKIVTIAKDLAVPWEVAFLPNDEMLVTERAGNLLRISGTSQKFIIKGVEQTSEGGLLGAAVHPEFSTNHWVYLYYTTLKSGSLTNVVERYTLEDDTLDDPVTILKDVPAAANHDGGRLAFGPDKKLYITTGDAGDEATAQDTASLAGKILRLNDDGSIPEDNTFSNEIYSYGHRNAQGLAWDKDGQLWATEHGRSGVKSGFDELNLIKKGANYGWPVIEGDETRSGMVAPVLHSGATETWAPSGLTYSKGSLFFGGLRGQTLYEAQLGNSNTVTSLQAHFREEYGRIRAVVNHNGAIYVTTSNTDGRGMPTAGDDRILRISRSAFMP